MQGAARAKDAPQGSKGGSTGDGSTSRMVQLMDEAATSAPPTITLILQFEFIRGRNLQLRESSVLL